MPDPRLDPRGIKPSGTDGDILKTVDGVATWGTGGGATVLDELTDVDTSTTPPADGQGFVFVAASALWVPGNVVRSIVAGTNVTVDDTDPLHPVISASGGGGGGSSTNGPDGKPTVNTPPTTANAKDDEFNDGTSMSGPVNGLAAKWSKHNMATASWTVLDASKAPGALMFDIPTGQAADQAIYQTAPSGDFRISSRLALLTAADRQMWALLIVDASGNGVCVNMDDPASDTSRLRSVVAWQQSAALASIPSPNPNYGWVGRQSMYLTLRKSGTTYYAAVWGSERTLAAGAPEVSATSSITPAYVGIGRVFGTGVGRVVCDWFRVS